MEEKTPRNLEDYVVPPIVIQTFENAAEGSREIVETKWVGNNLYAKTKCGKRIKFTNCQIKSFSLEPGNG